MYSLIIVEHTQHEIKAGTLSTLTAATQLGTPVTALVIGYQCHKVAQQIAQYQGVEKVLLIEDPCYEHPLAENFAAVIAQAGKNYTHLLAPGSTFGKDIMPRVAALLDICAISEVIEIIDKNTFVRPIYAGNALETVHSEQAYQVITIRTSAFPKAEKGEKVAVIEEITLQIPVQRTTFLDQQLTKSERPELEAARVVISGGRGMQSAENFAMLERIATKLNAALGASRAAVDAGFVPNDYQVGQTGKVVAPDLYIAVGISGAIQHVAGMKDSKVIVAINKDPDAPIFKVADYGLIGDLFTILPELESYL